MSASNATWSEIQAAIEKSKRDLKLSGEGIAKKIKECKGQLHPALWTLISLTKLEISSISSLEELPSDIAKLQNLKEFILSNTKISKLPPEIGKLSELKTFIGENNQLQELPKQFCELKNLQVLNLSGNQLSFFPSEFDKLAELITLNLTNNKFSDISLPIIKLLRLSTLSFCRNVLQSVPSEMANMLSLQTLDLSNNQLTEVPSFLGYAPKLKDLKLEGNPFKDKKFAKTLESGKTKNLIQQLKKIAPKPKKEEPPPREYRIKLLTYPTETITVTVHSNQTVRPFILMVLLKGIEFTDKSFKQFIDLQTDIHQSICKKRTLATIGTHDLSSIKPPLLYKSDPPSGITFVPLKQDKPICALELEKIFADANDQSMVKYLSLIKKETSWPVLFDSANEVLSLPPVVNSKYSQISLQTTDVLVECTSSTSQEICTQVLNALIDRFSKQLQEENPKSCLTVAQVKIASENGHVRHRYPLDMDIEDICKDDEEEEVDE